MITVRAPKTNEEFEQYYQLRWQLLRKPWQQAKGSEQDELEYQAVHRCIFDDKGQVIAVGRLHIDERFIGHIRYMAVADSNQGQGLGKKIISVLEHEAQLRNACTIKLNAREPAVRFYQSLEYKVIKKHTYFMMKFSIFTWRKHLNLLFFVNLIWWNNYRVHGIKPLH